MPDKNVQLPDGRIVSFPDSMADADIAAVIKKQLIKNAPDNLGHTLSNMTAAMSGQPMQTPQEQTEFEKGKKAGQVSATETVGGVLGGESVPAMRGLVGALARIFATGGGAAAGNVAGQLGTTGKVDPLETAKAGGTWGAFATGGEALGALGDARASLGRMLYGPDGQLSPWGRTIVHPTELPEQTLRAAIPEPAEQVAAREAYNKAKTLTEAQEAAAKMDAIKTKQAAAAARLEARNAPKPSPFPNATSTTTPIGNAELPAAAAAAIPRDIQFVDSFGKQSAGRIVEPGSTPPNVKVTYQSVPQSELLGKVMKGDINAINEWQRRGLDLPNNVKFLVEDAGAKPWRNYEK